MKRWLLHSVTLLSVLLCGLAAFGWYRSGRVHDDLWFGRPGWAVGVGPHRGTFVFYQVSAGPYSLSPGFHHTPGPAQVFDPEWFKTQGYSLWTYRWGRLGYVNAVGAAPGFAQRFFTVPAWLACAVTAAPPFAWALRRVGSRRRARVRRGLCRECGYDLRGSREICPECGAPAPGVAR